MQLRKGTIKAVTRTMVLDYIELILYLFFFLICNHVMTIFLAKKSIWDVCMIFFHIINPGLLAFFSLKVITSCSCYFIIMFYAIYIKKY